MLRRRLLQERNHFFSWVALGQVHRNRSSHSSPSFLALLRLNLHERVARHPIIWAVPLPLHLDAVLGRWMAEAMVDARQRTFADFWQHTQMNRSLFVRGRMRHYVRVAARQPVYGTLDRIHGHVELFALHSIRETRNPADEQPHGRSDA